ncbi:MAG: hypothetical protein JRN26_01085 [Nitrososphaerota archaeon]|jgi:hypothetical protein|nr:hypothetical protein [Nitrososphaerota archaeon]MDG6935474.1 hypothetical protein [Nitrososphaerota archaeon]MDG6944135.1 hypothetical protein [Nitrososphaerota archaeon]
MISDAEETAKELSILLEADYDEILYYITLLINKSQYFNLRAENDGLIIKGNDGHAVPLHPRMAISNLYRMSILKNPSVKDHRARIDELIAKLISISQSSKTFQSYQAKF